LGIDVGQRGDGDHFVGDRIERAQDTEALPPTGRLDPAPDETPQVTEKRAEDKMRRIHKKDRTLSRPGFG
jgi:hypothetical protein